MRLHEYQDKNDLIQKIEGIHNQAIHYDGLTDDPNCDLTNAMMSVRYMSEDYHRVSGNTTPKRLVAVVVSAGVANVYDHLASELKLLVSGGFDFITIGKEIKR